MHWPFVAAFALALTACRPALDKKLVGEWLSGCSIDICTVTMLKADHTFCQRFDDKTIPDVNVCGTWRIAGDQLVQRITWAASGVRQNVVGTEVHYTVSDFRGDEFFAKYAEDEK